MTDITVKDANKSPIHRAAYFGEIEDLKRCFVEEGYPHYNIKDEAGLTPLYLAAQMGYLDICEEILSKTKDASCKSHEDGTTPLHQAALHGHIQICQLLIDKMNDVDSRDFGGDTPLSYAALYGHGKLCEILMAKAKDINPSDNEGITVIHRAAYNKLWRICNTILDRIEDKNPKDLVNNTLLHLAAKFGNLQLVKRVMIESGDINPENKRKATPLQESILAGHLNVTEILRKMTNLHKGEGKFDWGKILNNLDDPIEENLQKMMYIDDSEALRAFLNNKSKTEVLAECIKVNQIGYNPLITAAEFLSIDSLLILLQFVSKIAAIGTKEEKEKCAETLHGGQGNNSLLSIVMQSEYFIGQIKLEVIECEGYLHDWSTSKFTACLHKRIGTNEMSLKCRELFSKKNAEERGKTKMKICVISLTTLVLAIYKASPASFDIGTDVTLLAKYGSATSIEEFIQANCSSFNNTILLNSDHDTIKSWTITLEECFWITLGPVLVPCFFNFVQIVSFVKKSKNKTCNGLLKYCMVFLSPIWLVVAALGEATEEFKISSSNSNTVEDEEETLTVFKQEFADAKFIEENDDDRMMESWKDLRSLVNMTGEYLLTQPYFREMRCLLVKQGGLDLFVKCSKTFPNNIDLIESMAGCMEFVVQEEELKNEMMRQDFVQQILTLVDPNNSHSCWLAMNLLGIMLNDGEEMWKKTKISFQDTIVKIDEIYNIWGISSVILPKYRPTFQDMFNLVQSNVPQLQRHALWSLAYFTSQGSNINYTTHSKMFFDEGGVQMLNDLPNLSEENIHLKTQVLENISVWENLRNA